MQRSVRWAIFQFTPLREGRRQGRAVPSPKNISIHAPPRGATILSAIISVNMTFQFTPLREGRLEYLWKELQGYKFQFTPLREGRRVTPSVYPFHRHFNSRPSARGDSMSYTTATPTKYFNSRPSARGDTRRNFHRVHFQAISIHAPPRGATRTLARLFCRTS